MRGLGTTLTRPLRRAMAAAATLTGKRFGLLVASSVVATSAIVAAAMTSSSNAGPLAALLGRSLAADRTPALIEPAPEAEEGFAPEAEPEASPEPVASEPEFAPEAEVTPEAAPEPEPEPEPTPEAPAPEAGRIKHVFVVSLASPGYDASLGATSQMPYLSGTLKAQGQLLSNYSLLDPAPLPNSLALTGGEAPTAATKSGCPDYDACVLPATTLSLADQLATAQFSWRGYIEGMVDAERQTGRLRPP